MKQLSSPKRFNRGVHGSGPSKQLSGSSLTLETQVTCSTHQSRSRTPSPQQQQIRGMDPGGLIAIPRRKLPATAVDKKSAKTEVVVAASSDKEVKWNELPTTQQQQQQQQETALVVASAVVTPPSILTITDDKASSSDKHEKNNNNNNSAHQVKEVALTLYKDSNKSGRSKSTTSSTAVGNNERVTEDKASEGRHYRAHLWSNSKEGNKRSSSSRPRASGTTTSRNDTGVDDNKKHHRSNKDDRGRKNKSKLSKSRSSRGNAKESKDAGEDRKNTKSGKTKKEQPDKKEDKQPATKKELSKRKKSKQLNSISGSREAIRSFSKRSGQKSNWKGDGEDGKNKGWKEGIGSSNPEKSKSFIKRLGGKFSAKSATVAEDTADENEVGGSTEISPSTSVGAVAPTEKSLVPFSRGKARGRSQFQQRAASKRDVRSNSPPSPQDIRRRPSLSPDRSMSPQSHSSRGSFYSGSRSPSPSPRRNRRSLSPHSSSRGSSYSGSRSPSPRRRRSFSSHSCSSYSRSRSPSPSRRRSMTSQSSCASGSVSYYSRSMSPSPRRSRRLKRSVSPPSPRYRSRGRRFHSRSRTLSPRRMREFGGARRMRSPPPRVNQNRRGSFRSMSPPRGRTPNNYPPMRKQASFHVMPRQHSFLSRSRSPEPRGGRRQMSAHGNQHQNRGPNRRPQPMSRRRSISSGYHRRGSSSPPLNRQNSDFVPPRTKVAPVGTTLRRSAFQNESRITRSPSPPRMRPQSQQRQISDVYKRPVRDESRALVIRGQSPSAEDTSMTSTSALVPGVESQSLRNKPAARQSSQSSESTGVWIDCPEQNDPCDEDLTFSECQGFRDDDSDATYDATHGLPPGPPSGAHSFATYEMPDGPPPASGRLVDLRKLTKPGRKNQGSNKTRSKAADPRRMSETVENSITGFEGSWRNKQTAGLAEDHEGAKVRQLSLAAQSLVGQGIARKSTNGSLPSRDEKQSPHFVPGPPPRKPPMNMSSASVSEPPRSKSPKFVRNNRSSSGDSRTNIESNGPANIQKAQGNDPPYSNRPSPPPPPPFLHRPNDSPMETHQPVASNPSFQNLFEGPSEKNWQQYLTKGKRNTSIQRGSSRSNSPERDSSRGRRASSTGRTSRERSLSAGRKLFGRAPEKLDYNDREVNNVVNSMPFTDKFGDPGIYSGQVNDNGRPNGKGSMKYDNGIFYEGTWTDGGQDEEAATQYARIRGGFTSWGGKGTVAVKSGKTMPWNAHKNDKHDENDTTYVRGMEWVDLNGDAGRYTGEVNNDKVPHGEGIMKYDFGLIAQGEWVYGVLKENPHDCVLSAAELSAKGQGADAMSIMSSLRSLKGGGMSVGPGVGGGMSVGPMMRPPMMLGGGMSAGPGMGSAMSVGPGMSVAQGSAYSGMPQMMMQPQQMMMIQPQLPPPMMMPQPNTLASQQNAALVAQQNAMAQAMAMYGGQPMNQMTARPPQRLMPMQQQQHTMQGDPPITEIKFS